MKQLIPKETLEKLAITLNDKSQKVSAVLVVESKKTNKDYTYFIKSYTKRDTFIVAIGVETFASSFIPYYYIINGHIKPIIFESQNKKGGQWILDKLFVSQIDGILEKVNIYHTGNCIKCNRPLTDLLSIELGIGPVCRDSDKKPFNREN
jgi:hypothetical protein